MHFEYAVEPAVIGKSWAAFRDLIDRFGSDKGRLISGMPEEWRKEVFQVAVAAGVGEMDKTRILESLKPDKTRHKVVCFQRGYNTTLNWVDNALREHQNEPFRAIICSREENGCEEALSHDDCTDDHPLMDTPRSKNIIRTPEKIVEALLPIARVSKEIDIVDPYFDHRPGRGHYIETLKTLLESLAKSKGRVKSIRIHYAAHDSYPPAIEIAKSWNRLARNVVPEGYSLELHGWSEHTRGEDLHDRYFLTDIGGIMVGAGFSAEGPEQTALFTLLDYRDVQELRERFSPTSIVYNKVGSTVRIDSKGAKILDE